MLPGNHEVFNRSFAEGQPPPHPPTHPPPCSFTSDATSRCPSALDGNQVLDFYWIDPIDAMKRSVAKLQYNGKLYTSFMPGTSIFHPEDRAFDLANSGMVFQAAWLVDRGSSPLLALFYADASFSGQSMTHHPIYGTYFFNYVHYVIYIHYILHMYYCDYCSTECLLNLHEDERMKPRNWIPVGWIPVYDESRDKRPKKGFDSTSARKVRLYHQCWIEFLDGWAERTKDAVLLPWADGETRSTRLFIGGVLGDQQEGDKYTGEPCMCHRCYAPRKRYLDTEDFEVKTMRKVRQRVECAAAGGFMKGSNRTRIVKWDPDGRNVRPGPGIITIIGIICIIYVISPFYSFFRSTIL